MPCPLMPMRARGAPDNSLSYPMTISGAAILWERWRLLLGIMGFLLVATMRSASAQDADEPDYEWQPVTMNAPWAARDGAGILSFQGKLWLLGGWNPGNRHDFPMIC